MEQDRKTLHEIHRRFAFGILMRMEADDLRSFVTGEHDEEQGAF